MRWISGRASRTAHAQLRADDDLEAGQRATSSAALTGYKTKRMRREVLLEEEERMGGEWRIRGGWAAVFILYWLPPCT